MFDTQRFINVLADINHINQLTKLKHNRDYNTLVGDIYEHYCIYVLRLNGYVTLSWYEYAKANNLDHVKDIGIDIMCIDSYGTAYPVQCKYRSKILDLKDVDHFYMNLERYYGNEKHNSVLLTNVTTAKTWNFNKMQILTLTGSLINYKLWLQNNTALDKLSPHELINADMTVVNIAVDNMRMIKWMWKKLKISVYNIIKNIS